MKEKIIKVASWGKYVFRSEIERLNFGHCIQNDESGVRYFIYSSQWLASLYVAIEGWESLKLQDNRIDKLLSLYEDYVLILKRCRNAVYHYQEDVLDKRVHKAVGDQELLIWAEVLLNEFIRFLYLYPIANCICKESLHLQKEYLDLIGWSPKETNVEKWFETIVYVFQYYDGKNSELLERSHENDIKIELVIKNLISLEINPQFSKLSRI